MLRDKLSCFAIGGADKNTRLAGLDDPIDFTRDEQTEEIMAQGCQVDIRSGQSRTELLQRLKGKKPNILQTVGFDLVHQMGPLGPVPDKNKENSSVAFLKDLRRLEDGVEQM